MERTGAVITWNTLQEIKGIPLQMSQLFFNLSGNSLKFIRTDTKPEIQIHCRIASLEETGLMNLKNDATYYKIIFTDNGIGMKPENIQKIFSIFQRLHRKDEFAGTGIGLAISKKNVQNHNGEINAEGSSESGAVFNIYLPADN